MDEFRPGRYKHFKGGEYDAICVGYSSERRNEKFVVYRSIEKEIVWIRPYDMFFEHVEREGYKGPRFTYLGDTS